MKFELETSNLPLITSYDPNGFIQIGPKRFSHSFVMSWHGDRFDWDITNFESLKAEHFAHLAQLKPSPELIIFGSGAVLRFPPPSVLTSLMQARIGIETMDLAAACRTYNILVSEGRHVVGAFLIEAPPEH